ncbi:hypothetical protein KAH37_05060 [bacterium]|nr:hypothetical protein [bacterium]
MKKKIFVVLIVSIVFLMSCSSGEETASLTDSDGGTQSDNHTQNDGLIIGDDSDIDSSSHNDNLIIPDEDIGLDSDGDGIPDEIERPKGIAVDTDGDGTPDYLDDDSDGDGIPDSTEGVTDTDGDGTPNYRDEDSDQDNIPDSVEKGDGLPPVDTDKDGAPDYIDADSDNDTIPDLQEGSKDSDGDGIANYLDLDSDNDTILDKDEAGAGDPPQDSDGDGYPDFVDLDSDNDGLKDSVEAGLGTDPTKVDTDGDGFDDNTENTAGSNPLVKDPEFYEGQFYVILPYNDPEKDDKLKFFTEIKKADVLIEMDLSSSMGYARDNVKADIKNVIISGIAAAVPDAAFGIASFASIEGSPYTMNQTITTDAALIQTAVNTLNNLGGGDIESQYEAMYQAVTGAGFDGDLLRATFDYGEWLADEMFYRIYSEVRIAPQDCSAHEGAIGGACFRDAALPIVIMITDEQLYDINKDWVSDTSGGVTKLRYKWRDAKPDEGHYEAETIAAFNDINAKFIGVLGEGIGDLVFDIRERYESLADGTKSTSVTGDYFIFEIDMAGRGLSNQIVDAVQDLLLNIRLDITTEQESIANSHGVVDTTAFIKTIIPDSSIPPNSYSSKDTTMFYEVKPGIHILFDVTFENTIYENKDTEDHLFLAKIHVYGEGAYLDTRNVYIIVPGVKDDGGLDH